MIAAGGVPYGSWSSTHEDGSHRVRVSAGSTPGAPRVSVTDLEDGERFTVRDVHCRGGWLSFRVRVPSTGYRTRRRMTALDDDAALMEFTPPAERWAADDRPEPYGPRGRPAAADGPVDDGFFGTWRFREADDEACSAVRVHVRPAADGAEVMAWDAFCGAAMDVSAVRGRGRTLRLDTRGAGAAFAASVRLRLTGQGAVRAWVTFREVYERA